MVEKYRVRANREQLEDIGISYDLKGCVGNLIKKYPKNAKFYIQNGYVGNSILWWGRNSNGYTPDITKAEIYTKEEVLKRFVGGREEDIIWENNYILNNIRLHVNG